MKKKLTFMLLISLIMPLFALFGCDEVSSYPVTVYPSSAIYGSVSGNGTYSEGTTVQLIANAKQGSHFIAWIYQNTTQIENNATYSISNTLNSEDKATKSVLRFTMNSNTQGTYTAVFAERKIMYVKFDSLWLTTNPENTPVESDITSPVVMTANLDLSQGGSEMNTIFEKDGIELRENVLIRPEKMLSVLRLHPTSTQHIRANTQFKYNETNITINFRADIDFQESTEIKDGNNYTYQIQYKDGNYKIIFNFKLPAKSYYLILNYKEL